MGALAGRSAGAIGHRYEIGSQRGQPVDGVPQAALHLLGPGRKELKGNPREFCRGMAVVRGGRHLGHGTMNSTAALRTSGLAAGHQNRPNRPSHIAHRRWEIAQYFITDCILRLTFMEMGKAGRMMRVVGREKLAYYICCFRRKSQYTVSRCFRFRWWAGDDIILIQTCLPTFLSGYRSATRVGARLICAAGAFVGPACRTRLAS
jgi:hypothetical protein